MYKEMQDNNPIKNSEQDLFEELLKSKLEGHRIPVSTERWSAIEKQISPKRKAIKWWYAASVAAAIGILVWLVFPTQEEMNMHEQLAETAITTHKQEKQPVNKEESKPIVIEEDAPLKPIAEHVKKAATPVTKTTDDTNTEFITAIADSKSIDKKEEESERLIDPEQKEEQDTVVEVERVPKQEQSEQDRTRIILENKRLLAEAKKKEKTQGWSVGVNAGFGSEISLNFSNEDMDASYAPGEPEEPPFTPQDINKQAWSYEHKLPFSIGFMVRKEFNKYLSLETGLSYTFLSSDIKRTAQTSPLFHTMQVGDNQIHYLGIPVNVVGTLWRKKNWSIYLSAGAMVEKGISWKQNIQTYEGDTHIGSETLTKSWLHGVQWSINGAAGVSFHITPSWSIYLEPRVSYYPDNDQPISIRTDKGTLFNLSGGVKFNL